MEKHGSSDKASGRSTSSPDHPCTTQAQACARASMHVPAPTSASAHTAASASARTAAPAAARAAAPSATHVPAHTSARAAAPVAGQAAAAPAAAPSAPTQASCAWTPSQFVGTRERAGRKRSVREYTLGEEIANSVTHGIGAALAIAALVLLVVRAVGDGAGIYLLAALVYGIAMLVEYLMSTLYHAIAHDGAKRVFKVLDHSCIYLLIAGTYTPYCLITLGDVGGVWLAAFVWTAAVVGIALEAFWTFRPRWVSAVIYVLMGWCVVAFLPQLYALLPALGFWLLAAGGISYTVGAVFYVLKKVPYMHSVFHLLVLAGSVLQFLSVFMYVL